MTGYYNRGLIYPYVIRNPVLVRTYRTPEICTKKKSCQNHLISTTNYQVKLLW